MMANELIRAAEYLRDFKTPESIRCECQRRGIKGESTLYRCPLANLLSQRFGVKWYIRPDTVADKSCMRTVDGRDVSPIPAAANSFALNFDNREYPELDLVC